MLLTRQSRIAINLLVTCARADGRYVHTYEAAAGTGASKEHAAKVAYLMRCAGLIKSSRGRNGGIALARPAHRISIGDVLCHTQPEMSPSEQSQPADDPSSAVFSAIVEVAWSGFHELMERFTIDDLVTERAPQRLPCTGCSRMQRDVLPRNTAPATPVTANRDAHAQPIHS